MPPQSEVRPPLSQALALGLLHGPAELLPVSSSGHVALAPWLLGWDFADASPELRKSFEVALHAGTAAALLITLRDELAEAAGDLSARRLTLVLLSFAPPAVCGLLLERAIETRLGTPRSIALGLMAGAAVMALADSRPGWRSHESAGARDALWLGVAQAAALIPGVSRNGATLSAGRLLGFRRADANRLSRHVALPVIAGASSLKAIRLRQGDVRKGALPVLVAGGGASFLSTLGSTWLIRQVERDRSLMPYALYRLALGAATLRRIRSGRCRRIQRT